MAYKKTIYLTRHGETEYNKQGIIQGSGVDSDLNETGLRQAELFYEHYGHISFDKIYTSALKRTYQSVRHFIEKKNIPHEKMAGLNEIMWGKYEGKPTNPNWRAEYFEMIAQWENGNLEHRVPGGENPIELQQRQKPALEHILNQTPEQQILICMHGRAMRSFLCLMMDKHLSQMDSFGHRNLGLYIIEYNAGQFSIIKENSDEHLQSLAI